MAADAGACTIHPLTLAFSDPKVEGQLRARQFRSSYRVYMVVMLGSLCLHVLLPIFHPASALISYIYIPHIVVVIGLRVALSYHSDHLRAHSLLSRAWLVVVAVAFTIHRITMHTPQLHRRAGQLEAGLYCLSIGCICFALHLMHFGFAVRLWIGLVFWLVPGTLGYTFGLPWLENESFSVMGQPYDLISFGITVLLAFSLGHLVEHMLRDAFLERQGAAASAAAAAADVRLPPVSTVAQRVAEDITPYNFETVGLLGRGSAGDVFLVHRRADGAAGQPPQLYALKRISKARVRKQRQDHILEECHILRLVSHPFVVHLEEAFQTDRYFYYAMTYAGGGDLTMWFGEFTTASARVVMAEILLAIGVRRARRRWGLQRRARRRWGLQRRARRLLTALGSGGRGCPACGPLCLMATAPSLSTLCQPPRPPSCPP